MDLTSPKNSLRAPISIKVLDCAEQILKLIFFPGFFDENFPGNAADLSFKDHSFSSSHGEVVTT